MTCGMQMTWSHALDADAASFPCNWKITPQSAVSHLCALSLHPLVVDLTRNGRPITASCSTAFWTPPSPLPPPPSSDPGPHLGSVALRLQGKPALLLQLPRPQCCECPCVEAHPTPDPYDPAATAPCDITCCGWDAHASGGGGTQPWACEGGGLGSGPMGGAARDAGCKGAATRSVQARPVVPPPS